MLVVAAVALVASLVALALVMLSYLQGQQEYEELTELAAVDPVALARGDESGFHVDWDALRAINPDVVAWIDIPGADIDYPVVQGGDNEYYLSHDFHGYEGWLARYGAIFMDYRNDPDWNDEGYFIYGHNMSDGSMFHGVALMADQGRFDASRTVFLLSPTRNFELKTFALIHCAADETIVNTSFATKEDMAAYVQDKIDRSIVYVGDAPSAREVSRLFAFATCDDGSGGRYVLYAYEEA